MNKSDYSVLINVRNGDKYLMRAIEQINKQTIKPSKVIIFDNYSSDNTNNLITKIIKSNPDLYVSRRSQSSLSLYRARNYALQLSNTKYVCFLDIDDLWDQKKAEKQIKLLNKNNSAIACISEYKKVFENEFNIFTYSENVCNVDHILERNFYRFITKYNIHFSSIMFNRSNLIKKLGVSPFNKNLTILGDIELFIKLFGKNNIIILRENMSSYIFHNTNTGLLNYHKITIESFIVAFELICKLRLARAFYIIFIYNLKYFLFLLSSFKKNLKSLYFIK